MCWKKGDSPNITIDDDDIHILEINLLEFQAFVNSAPE